MHDGELGQAGNGELPDVTRWPLHVQGEQYEQGFALLPVLDLMRGQVVAARAGAREHYAPIQSPLAAGSAPPVLLAALLARTGSPAAYVADLDGIRFGTPQAGVMRELLRAFPAVTLWLDGGFASLEAGLEQSAAGRVLPVLGTETLQGWCDLARPEGFERCVLSLDFGPEGFRGDPCWLDWPHGWPRRVIVMSLAQVGMAQGPDLQRLRACLAQAGSTRQVYAAGGVRDAADVAALRRAGVAGALVATALHARRLP